MAAYTLDQANQTLTLGSRIAQLQQDGAQVIVSFGGQCHTSLDVACTSVPSLTQAYQSVINTYHLTTIDLDIEGAALTSFAAEQRRAAAVAALEQAARAAHRQLSVWLTLPVEPSGLQDNALSVIDVHAAGPRLHHRDQRHDHGLHPAAGRREHDAALGARPR